MKNYLQSHGESLTNDELPELAEQRNQSEFTASDAEEEHLCENFLQNSSAKHHLDRANHGPIHR
jgi:hypothetical protein